jgi:hypothetical protein
VIEAVAYLALALAVTGLGVWLGMILAGRIERRLAPPDAEPPPSHEEQP